MKQYRGWLCMDRAFARTLSVLLAILIFLTTWVLAGPGTDVYAEDADGLGLSDGQETVPLWLLGKNSDSPDLSDGQETVPLWLLDGRADGLGLSDGQATIVAPIGFSLIAEPPQNTSLGLSLVDSIALTRNGDVVASWSPGMPTLDFNPYENTVDGIMTWETYKFELNFSQKPGTTLSSGDSFTFEIPSFLPVSNVSGSIYVQGSSTVAVTTYSITSNVVTVTFTDYVDTHSNIEGNFWYSIWSYAVESDTPEELKFVIDSEIVAGPESITLIRPNLIPPKKAPHKVGWYTGSSRIGADGKTYFIYGWTVYLHGDFGTGGPNIPASPYMDFSFADTISADSPHQFLTYDLWNSLRTTSPSWSDFWRNVAVHEYNKADDIAIGSHGNTLAAARYGKYSEDYTFDSRTHYTHTFTAQNNATATTSPTPYPGGLSEDTADTYPYTGISVSDVSYTVGPTGDKVFFAKIGDITRPTHITYYTISTDNISEDALTGSGTIEEINNTFAGSHIQSLSAELNKSSSSSGGSATGKVYEFTFIKTDEHGSPIRGARFKLYDDSAFTGGYRAIATSGTDGQVTFGNLPGGETYYFVEDEAPPGHVLDNTIYELVLDAVGKGTVAPYGSGSDSLLSGDPDSGYKIRNIGESHILTFTLTFTKADDQNAALEGAAFRLYDNPALTGTPVAQASSGSSGAVTFTGLSDSTAYYLTEIGAPHGYLLSNTVYRVDMDANGAATITVLRDDGSLLSGSADSGYTIHNTKEPRIFTFTKADDQNAALEGAAFKLYDNPALTGTPVAQASSGSNGAVTFTGLSDSTAYYLTESAAPAGYIKNGAVYRVDMDADGAATITVLRGDGSLLSGSPISGYTIKNDSVSYPVTFTLTFTKADNQNAALEGAAFRLYDNPALTGTPVAQVSSGSNGAVTFTGLSDSTAYYLTESAAPAGYLKDGAVYRVDMDADGAATISLYSGNSSLLSGEATSGYRIRNNKSSSGGNSTGGSEQQHGGSVPGGRGPNTGGGTNVTWGSGTSTSGGNPNTSGFTPIGSLPVPLTQLPYTEIFDDDAPLASNPSTGNSRSLAGAAVMLALSGTCAACVLAGEKRKKAKKRVKMGRWITLVAAVLLTQLWSIPAEAAINAYTLERDDLLQRISETVRHGEISYTSYYNINEVSLASLQDAADASRSAGGRVFINFDTLEGDRVAARITVNPMLVGDSLGSYSFIVDTTATTNAAVKARFEAILKRPVAVMLCEQGGEFKMPVVLAGRLDLTGINKDNLIAYVYDSKENSYSQIRDAQCVTDDNGFVYLQVRQGGYIVITSPD